ncbi:MAG: hypothetical protein V9H69_24195 [Anaerolineae bacterium]
MSAQTGKDKAGLPLPSLIDLTTSFHRWIDWTSAGGADGSWYTKVACISGGAQHLEARNDPFAIGASMTYNSAMIFIETPVFTRSTWHERPGF